MQHSIAFNVVGTPYAQPRPRFVRGRVISTASKGAKLWSEAIRRTIRDLAVTPISGPVEVMLAFYMPTRFTDRWGTEHTMKPDVDNTAKLAIDAFTRAGVFGDDCQVSRLTAVKFWAEHGGMGATIRSI